MRKTVGILVAAIVLGFVPAALAQDSGSWPMRDFSEAAGAQYNVSDPPPPAEEPEEPGTAPGAGGGSPGTAPGSGSGSGTGGAGVPPVGGAPGGEEPSSVTVLSLGKSSDATEGDIVAALAQAGLFFRDGGELTDARIEEFLGSDLADQVASGDAEAVGRAIGRQLAAPTPLTQQVIAALTGSDVPLEPVTRLVVTQSVEAEGDVADLHKGLSSGLQESGVVLAYAERSQAGTSFVSDFKELGISTVDNVDEADGRAALIAILINVAAGAFGDKDTADAALSGGEVQVKPASAYVGPVQGDGLPGGATPYVLLLAVGIALGTWVGVGRRTVRRRRPAHAGSSRR